MNAEHLVMMPYAEARAILREQALHFRLLEPPFPSLGVGALRVLRLRALEDGRLEMLAGYERYERLEAP